MDALADSVRETRVLSRLGFGLVTIGWVFFLWRASDVFRPDSAFVPRYNSDVAIPLLMADEPHPSPFSLYYYGQDRYGAWPFLLAHVLGRVAHFSWSPERLSIWLTLFMFSAAWPLWRLAGKTDFIVPGYLGILLLNPVVQFNREPYGWQASTLVWTWWSLRRLSSGQNTRFWLAAACLGSILAVWISPLSGAILAVLPVLEWGLARRKNFLTMLIAPAIGIGVEKLLRAWFHQYARVTFPQYSYEVPLELDRGHLPQNAAAMWKLLAGRPWWIVQVGVVLAGAFFLVSWVKRLLRKGGPAQESRDIWRALAIGCAAICVVTFAATVAVSHVRYNLYSERYLTLVHLFGGIGAVASIIAILPIRPISMRARNGLSLALTVLLTTLVALRIPPLTINPAYAELKAGADWLANRPVQIVLGGYWGTYVFAGLAVPKKVIPIPLDSQRTPWTDGALHQPAQVVVSTYETDRFGPANDPDRWVTDRGEFLQRAETPRFSRGAVTFWIYRNATMRALPISTSSVRIWNACGDAPLSIDLGKIESFELVYWGQAEAPRPKIEVVGHTTQEEKRAPDAIDHGARMTRYVFENGPAINGVTLQPKRQQKECVLEALALFKR